MNQNLKLRETLLQLPKNGKEFETLVVRALEHSLGRRVWLARSGSQRGADMGTSLDKLPHIRLEAKLYADQASFNERELLGEIAQALQANPNLDLWILATSAEVPEQICDALAREADERGIGLEILDLSQSPHSKLPRLLAHSEYETVAFLKEVLGEGATSQTGELLAAIRAREGMAPSLQEDLLHDKNLVCQVARRARDFVQELIVNRSRARQILGQEVHGETFISRVAARNALDHWFQHEPSRLMAFLGEEGVGKTWSVYDWLGDQCRRHDILPIIIPASRAVSMESPEQEIARYFTRLFNDPNTEHWQRRLNRWLEIEEHRRRLLLIVDGINEEPTANWRPILQQLFEDKCHPTSLADSSKHNIQARFRVIATCRTAYWKPRFSTLDHWNVREFSLGPFSDQELADYLHLHNRRPEDFRREIWDLVRIPRHSDRVMRHYNNLIKDGDISRERLLYEDWLDRYQRKGSTALTDEEFQNFLQNLAEKALKDQKEYADCDLRQLLASDKSEKVLVELKTSGILTGTRNSRLHPERLHLALGLLLLDELKSSQEQPAERLEELIAKYFEPAGIDEHASVCSAAIFACTRCETPEHIILLLFHAFFSLQNIPDDYWARISVYFPVFPNTYRQLAESLVRDDGYQKAWAVVAWAYNRWCDDERLRPTILEHCARWLSLIPLDSPWGNQPADKQERYRRRLTDLFGWNVDAGDIGVHETNCVKLEIVNWKDLHRLQNFAIDLISSRPAYIDVAILRFWALSATVQDFLICESEMWWIIKFLSPASTKQLVEMLKEMLQVENSIWQEAAFHLAWMLPDGRSEQLQAQSSYNRRKSYYQERYEEDKCSIPFWRNEDYTECLCRQDVDIKSKARNLSQQAINPEFLLPAKCRAELIQSLAEPLAQINEDDLRHHYRTAATSRLEEVQNALARWKPAEYAEFLKASIAAVVNFDFVKLDNEEESEINFSQLEFRSRDIGSLLLILHSSDVNNLRDFWRKWCSQAPEDRKNQTVSGNIDLLEADIFRIILSASTPEQRAALILERPEGSFDLADLVDALPLNLLKEESRSLWNQLFALADEQLSEKLFFLALEAPTLSTIERHRLVGLGRTVKSECQRLAALIALLSKDHELVRMLLQADCGLDYEFIADRYWVPSGAIPDDIPIEQLKRSVSTNLLSHILEPRRSKADLIQFADLIRMHVKEGACSRQPRHHWDPVTSRDRSDFSIVTLANVFEADPACLDELLGALQVQSALSPVKHSFRLYCALCKYLLANSRAEALPLANRLIATWYEDDNDMPQPHPVISLLAPWAGRPDVGELLSNCLDLCVTDPSLQSFALSFAHTDETWLWQKIEADLSSDRALLKARVLALAGFMLDTERSTKYLTEVAKNTDWWLDTVRQESLDSAKNGHWAKHWFTQFLQRKDLTGSWAAFQLFLEVVDRRFWSWVSRVLDAEGFNWRDGSPKMRHLCANTERIHRKIDEVEKKLKKTFCHAKIEEKSYPWKKQWRLSVENRRAFFRE